MRGLRRHLLRLGLLAPCAAAALAFPATAGAVSYHSNTVPMPGNSYTTVSVSCPPGQVAVGGGVADSAAFGDGGVVRTRPTLADDGWTATVLAAPEAPDGTVTAYATCMSPPAKSHLFVQEETAQAQTGEVKSAVATCINGKAVGGGVDASDLGVAYGSRPVDGPDAGGKADDAWKGTMYNVVGGAVNFQAYVVCARGKIAGRLRYVHESRRADGISETSLAAKCPADTKDVGGGGSAGLVPGLGILAATRPRDAADADSTPDDGWIAAFDNDGTTPVGMKTFAVCLA